MLNENDMVIVEMQFPKNKILHKGIVIQTEDEIIIDCLDKLQIRIKKG